MYWDTLLGSFWLVQDSGSELMCWCVRAAVLPKHNSLVELAQLSRCGTLLGLLALKSFYYVRCSSIFLGRNSSSTQHPYQWCGVGVSCVPGMNCSSRALLSRLGGASTEFLGWGSGIDGWMEHSAQQCMKENVKNLLQEDGPTQPII